MFHESRFYAPQALVFVFALLIPCCSAASDDRIRNGYDFIVSVRDSVTVEHVHDDSDRQTEVSPHSFVANGLLTVYQTFISSQDKSVCNFQPSCSHFARDAINRCGMFKGILMASDRLLRCHPHSLLQYRINPRTGKAIDPVDDYMDK